MSVAAFLEKSKIDSESWRYTNLAGLLAAPRPHVASNANSAPTDDADQTRFVFLNGVWQSKLSKLAAVPSCILMGDLESGYEIVLGEHTCLVAQPIELAFLTDEHAPSEINFKFSIDVGTNGRLTLLEVHDASAAITTIQTEISLRESAKFVHGKIVHASSHLASTTVHVGQGAFYDNFCVLRGGFPARNEIDVHLDGRESQAALNGMMLLANSDHADTTTRITHHAPECSSRQIYKTVLTGKAHGVFQGKIIVAEHAQKTDGYQLSRALLLSDQAEMNAKPELEIYADDVKCSHGSSIGDIDENAMFYLRARGLNETQARALLIEAFVAEMLDEVKVEAWRARFSREIIGWSQ